MFEFNIVSLKMNVIQIGPTKRHAMFSIETQNCMQEWKSTEHFVTEPQTIWGTSQTMSKTHHSLNGQMNPFNSMGTLLAFIV